MDIKAKEVKPGFFSWLKHRYDIMSIAVLGGATWVASVKIPQLDPTAGVDIWGDLSKIPTILLAAACAASLVYLLDKLFFRFLTDKEEVALIKSAVEQKNTQAVAVLVWCGIRVLIPFVYIFKQLVGA